MVSVSFSFLFIEIKCEYVEEALLEMVPFLHEGDPDEERKGGEGGAGTGIGVKELRGLCEPSLTGLETPMSTEDLMPPDGLGWHLLKWIISSSPALLLNAAVRGENCAGDALLSADVAGSASEVLFLLSPPSVTSLSDPLLCFDVCGAVFLTTHTFAFGTLEMKRSHSASSNIVP